MAPSPTRGRFISLEGGEGVGKSTQVRGLAGALRSRGHDVIETREPGGSAGGEAIRALLLGGAEERWSAKAEALLFAAARTDHVDKVIRPAIEAGRWVLCDRFIDSSLAYQGVAGGLGLDEVRAINAFGIGEMFPDRTFLLVNPDAAGRARERDGIDVDRIGGRPEDYHRRVSSGFQMIADQEPARIQVINACGPVETVTARLLEALADLL